MVQPLDLRTLAQKAVNAPSGDNAQPWRFRLDGSAITLFNEEGADQTLYNFRERGSYLSHGAVAENLRLLAAARSFSARIEPFPGESNATARITFAEERDLRDELVEAIPLRATNRKPYEKRPLEPQHRAAMERAAADIPGVRLILVEEHPGMEELARHISINEWLLMENKHLHDFLFGMIRWTRQEERAKPGLYVKTMEFPPPLRLMLRYVLVHWSAVLALNRIGLSRNISKQTNALYAASSAIGAFIVPAERDTDFFNAGRAFQRLSLAATRAGASLQPLAALPYLAQRLRANEADMFSPEHRALIAAANRGITGILGIPEYSSIAMLFRLGYGNPPTARSRKLPPAFIS